MFPLALISLLSLSDQVTASPLASRLCLPTNRFILKIFYTYTYFFFLLWDRFSSNVRKVRHYVIVITTCKLGLDRRNIERWRILYFAFCIICSVFCILYYHNLFFVFIFISLFRFLSYSFCSDGDSRTKSVSRNHVNRPFLSRTIRLWHFHSCRPKVVKRIHVFYINYCNVYNQHIQMYQFPVDVYDKIKVLKTSHL